jgi:hypothetical protein
MTDRNLLPSFGNTTINNGGLKEACETRVTVVVSDRAQSSLTE